MFVYIPFSEYMTIKETLKVKTVSATSPTVEASTNQQQQIVDKPIILLDEFEKSKDKQKEKQQED